MFIFTAAVGTLLSISVFAQDCKPVDFGKGSIVCECNSTYCDFYADDTSISKGEFIWYISSKSGERLKRIDGKIAYPTIHNPKNGYTIKINSKKEYQTMQGFGGAFTDASGINILNLSPGTQDNLLRSYFSTHGSKYNFGRIPIGGTDFSTRVYTYDDFADDIHLQRFTLADEDIKYKIPLLKKALELNPSLRLLAASWTAPSWMKNTDSFNGFSYLLEKYYQVYANYIVKFLEEYQKQGLEIWAVSTGNEPFTPLININHINAMFWTSGSTSKWVIENLGPTLQSSSSNNTSILMLDDQRSILPFYMLDVKLKHKEALKYVKGIALHWYMDSFFPVGALDFTNSILPDKFILMTESCVGDRPWDTPKVILGSWDRAERLIKKLFENINHWVTGWIDWNLALDLQGGPNWIKNYVDASIIVDKENDVFYKQPLYYAMTHFSKFVPRYSIRIESESSSRNILSLAFNTNDNGTVVLLYNKSKNNKHVSIIDERIGSINIELIGSSLHTILY